MRIDLVIPCYNEEEALPFLYDALLALAKREAAHPMRFVFVDDGSKDGTLGVLRRLAAHAAPGGRLVIGFGAGRGYAFESFFADAAAAGLHVDARFATWDLRPFDSSSEFLVAILSAPARS